MFLLYLEKQWNSAEPVMNLSILTGNELSGLLDIIHSLVFIENNVQFRQIVSSLKELVGCDCIILGVPKPNSNKELVIDDFNIDYPQTWVDLYREKELWRIEPAVFTAMKECSPLYWEDIYRKYPPEKSFLRLAYDFGLKNGWTCLARKNTSLPWKILSVSEDKKPQDTLTKRECEVLKWISRGKTSSEIAVILNVAVATINFHVKNINVKLNTVNRKHAVAVAAHNGLV